MFFKASLKLKVKKSLSQTGGIIRFSKILYWLLIKLKPVKVYVNPGLGLSGLEQNRALDSILRNSPPFISYHTITNWWPIWFPANMSVNATHGFQPTYDLIENAAQPNQPNTFGPNRTRC